VWLKVSYEDFKESVKNVADTFQKASEKTLGCVKNQSILKAQKASRYRGLLEACPKPFRNRECQAIVNGGVYCMLDVPCWRQEK